MDVPGSGEARIELDCAHGSVAIPLSVAEDGTFLWNGTYTVERAGPTRREDADSGPAARYRGSLEGETLTLTIETDSDRVVGPLVLTRNETPRIRKCR